MGFNNYPYTVDEGKKDYDFIGLSYNGIHTKDMNIKRVSDGNRYNENIGSTLTDKTAEVPGKDGMYYFSTQHKQREFSIKLATDGITEEQYCQVRNWFAVKGIHDLIFDEEPYKVWSAKVSGVPTFKFVCFDENPTTEFPHGQRKYKGEIDVKFICYFPYAHTPVVNGDTAAGRYLDYYDSSIYPTKSQWSSAAQLLASAGNEVSPTSSSEGMTYQYANTGDIPTPLTMTLTSMSSPVQMAIRASSSTATPLMSVSAAVPAS